MKSTIYLYRAYGLNISSSIQLPGLKCEETESDVNIRFDELESISQGNFREYALNNNFKLIFAKDITFILWKNKEVCSISRRGIIIKSLERMKKNFYEETILPLAFPILLQKRGLLVLHANAVNMNGSAVIFIGSKGMGKSTLSIALQKKGYMVLSDDISTVNVKNNIPFVSSGFSTLKLWPDVIRYVGENPDQMDKCYNNLDKRTYLNTDNFHEASLPLKLIYIIKDGNNSISESSPNQKSVFELVNATLYAKTFDNLQISENLKQCAEIVNEVSVNTLKIKRNLNDLHQVIEIIEADLFGR